jgi:multiple sugar transport system substrate-binding protein
VVERAHSFAFHMLAGLVLAAAVVAPAQAGAFDWRQFAGTTIHGIIFNDPGTKAYIAPQVAAFEKQTGINVRLEMMVDTQMRKKEDIILAGHDPSLDFFALQMDNRGIALTSAGLLQNLEPFLKNPKLTPADYDYPSDWAGGCLNTAKVMQGQPVNNIVYSAQAQVLHIRKDLFAKHHVRVPATMAELEVAAKALTIKDKSGNVETYGFLSRGWGRLTTASFASYLWNFGGSWIKTEGGRRVPNINSPQAIKALEFYGRMIRDYAPAAALDNRPNANGNLFAAGKVAMLSELSFYIYQFENPDESRVAGKVATILVPRGPAGSYPNLPTTSLAISPFSRHKEAAWLFIAWMTGKQHMLAGQKRGAPMCRKSVWTDPSYAPPTPSWGETSKLALEYGIAIAKPQTVAISEMRDAIGEVINTAIRNGSPAAIKAVADKEAGVMAGLMAKTEKGIKFQGVFRAGAKKLSPEQQMLPIKAITPAK